MVRIEHWFGSTADFNTYVRKQLRASVAAVVDNDNLDYRSAFLAVA